MKITYSTNSTDPIYWMEFLNPDNGGNDYNSFPTYSSPIVNFPNQGETCLRKQCPSCNGAERRHDGSMSIHAISCPCPCCTPRC